MWSTNLCTKFCFIACGYFVQTCGRKKLRIKKSCTFASAKMVPWENGRNRKRNLEVMSSEQKNWKLTVHEEVKAFLNQLGISFREFDGCIGFDYNGNGYALQKMDSDFMFELVHVYDSKKTDNRCLNIILDDIVSIIHNSFDMVRMIVYAVKDENTNVVFFEIQNIVYPGADIGDLMSFSLTQLDDAIGLAKQLIRCRLDGSARFDEILDKKLVELGIKDEEDEEPTDEELHKLIDINRNKYQA